ncbi:YehS family protein [Algoriphagus namhaensis]
MSNNDILRTLRYTFDFKDQEMMDIFGLSGREVTRAEVSNWLKREEDPEFAAIFDKDLAYFLNGLIIKNRGKKDGELPKAEKSLNNNQIFRKLRIALNYKEDDMLEVLSSVGMHISPHELSAFFRNPKQQQFRVCKDQVLRYFLRGLQKRYRKADQEG